jgi:hypothetical protein
LWQHKAEINAINEHGNTALHYACFWGFSELADDLVSKFGALVSVTNKEGDTPLDKCKGGLSTRLHGKNNDYDVKIQRRVDDGEKCKLQNELDEE